MDYRCIHNGLKNQNNKTKNEVAGGGEAMR